MKILLILALVASTHSYGQDAVSCAKKASNHALFIKTKNFIRMQISEVSQSLTKAGEFPLDYNPYADPKITAESVCSSGDSSYYGEDVKSKGIIIKRIGEDVRLKGKVSKSAFQGLDPFVDSEMTQREVCDSINKTLEESRYFGEEKSGCLEGQEAFLKTGSSIDYLNKSFKEACLEMYPQLIKYENNVRSCDDKKSKTVVNKDLTNNDKPVPKIETKNAPSVKQRAFKYLKSNGASAQ
jgi:hypothetical protein